MPSPSSSSRASSSTRSSSAPKTGDTETVLRTVHNIVCGDAYLIDGQSNALAVDWGPGEHPDTTRGSAATVPPTETPVTDGATRSAGTARGRSDVGPWISPAAWWKRQKIPICIINGAVGGTLIEMHQRNPANPPTRRRSTDACLQRIQSARLTYGIRGAADRGETTRLTKRTAVTAAELPSALRDMAAGWKEDYPNIQHYATSSESGPTRAPWATTAPATA